MNWKIILRFVFIALITNASYLFADEPILSWHTNMGSVGEDKAQGIAVDGNGNVYVAGYTESTWGNPIDPYAGGRDAFVAKLNTNGELQWNTFMGSSGWDEGLCVAVDEDENVYVTGNSDTSWGTPVHPHAGEDEGFAVKLNSNGERQWHTFMGHELVGEWARAIAVDTSGNVYVAGVGGFGWWDNTAPVNDPQGGLDVFVTKLSADGVRQWYTFMGSAGNDLNRHMAVDGSGNVYVAGRSEASWGDPVNPHAGAEDAFVAKLNTNGELQWNTFMGSASENDSAIGVAVDGSGNVYISGGGGEWGDPINPGGGAFAAKLNSSGVYLWHTSLDSEGVIYGWGLAIDESRNIFTGDWWASVQLSPDGMIQHHFAIPHGAGGEYQPIAVDTRGNVYFGGFMDEHWWIPPICPAIVPYTDGNGRDACVVKFETSVDIEIDIKPGSCPNPLNVKSKGVLPVAILGSADFDVTTVDPESIELNGIPLLRYGFEDVSTPFYGSADVCGDCISEGADGYMDMILKFDTEAVVASLEGFPNEDCVKLALTGSLIEGFGGKGIYGEDSVEIKGIKKKKKEELIFFDDFEEDDFEEKWISGSWCGPNTITNVDGRIQATENCNYIETKELFSGNLRIEVDVEKVGDEDYPCWDFFVQLLYPGVTGSILFDAWGVDGIGIGTNIHCSNQITIDGSAPNQGRAVLTYINSNFQFFFENSDGDVLTTNEIQFGSVSASPIRIHLAGFPDSPRYIDNVRIYQLE